jgi:DNA-binding CsgD family transcriptional regulator
LLYSEAQARARRAGSPASFVISSTFRGNVCCRLGELDEAEADNRAGLELALELGWDFWVPEAAAFLIDVLLERGDVDAAAEVIDRHELGGPLPDSFGGLFARCSHGHVLRAQRRPEEALAAFRDCGERLARWGIRNLNVVQWRSAAAGALHDLGDTAGAIELADEEVAIARQAGRPRALGQAMHARSLLATGTERITLLEEAVHVLEAAPAPLALARALTDLGAGMRIAGQQVAARAPLARALEIAHTRGAWAATARAREELVAAGARPRRPVTTGVDALTAAERRVATVAAADRTNAEVAQELFITVKTVEAHLGNVYRKLGISGRPQLRDALGPGSLPAKLSSPRAE